MNDTFRIMNTAGDLSQSRTLSLGKLLQKKYREQTHTFLIEGLRLCEEALSSRAKVLEIILDRCIKV